MFRCQMETQLPTHTYTYTRGLSERRRTSVHVAQEFRYAFLRAVTWSLFWYFPPSFSPFVIKIRNKNHMQPNVFFLPRHHLTIWQVCVRKQGKTECFCGHVLVFRHTTAQGISFSTTADGKITRKKKSGCRWARSTVLTKRRTFSPTLRVWHWELVNGYH